MLSVYSLTAVSCCSQVLTRLGAHFYRATATAVQPPDIFAIRCVCVVCVCVWCVCVVCVCLCV